MNRRKVLSLGLTILLILSAFPILTLTHPVLADGESWYDINWLFRKSHQINNSSQSAGTNYQVAIKCYYSSGTDNTESIQGDSYGKVYLNSHSNTDFSDVRFTSSDGSTPLYYWMEAKVDSSYAQFWVKVSGTLTATNQTIYVYYGNSVATSVSNGNSTFLFFDDFATAMNWTQWTSANHALYPWDSGRCQIVGQSGLVTMYTTNQFSGCCVMSREQGTTSEIAIYDLDTSDGSYAQDYATLYWYNYAPSHGFSVTLGGVANHTDHVEDYTTFFRRKYYDPAVGLGYHYWWDSTGAYIISMALYNPTSRTIHPAWFAQPAGEYGRIDDVCIRNYTNPEPSHGSWGIESGLMVNSIGVNSTKNYASDMMYANWSTGNGLGYGMFGYNGSGTFLNDTDWVNLNNATVAWFNVTKFIQVNVGDAIQWKEWVNNSVGLFGNTGLQNFTVTASITFDLVLVSTSQGDFQVNGSQAVNGSSATYNSPTTLRLEALPNSTSYFLNFSWSYAWSSSNRYNFTVVNDTTVYCYITILPAAPIQYAIARFDFTPSNPVINQAVTFNASQSYTTTGISQYGWAWSDSSSDVTSSNTITHIFTAVGLYNVTLNVTDSGATVSDFLFHLVNVTALPITPYTIARFDYNNSAPEPLEVVHFSAGWSATSGSFTGFSWDFDDGSAAGSGVSINHAFTLVGIYNVQVTATSDVGSDSFTLKVTCLWHVTPYVIAAFIVNGSAPLPTGTVLFDAAQSASSKTITSYDWDFGDTNTGSGVSVTHSYGAAGVYLVNLTITSSVGTNTLLENLTVISLSVATPYVVSRFRFTPSTAANNTLISFQGNFSVSDVAITIYTWDFGDGNVTSGVSIVSHKFAASGSYTVKLNVTSASGLDSFAFHNIVIGGASAAGSSSGGMLIVGAGFGLLFGILGMAALVKNGRKKKVSE